MIRKGGSARANLNDVLRKPGQTLGRPRVVERIKEQLYETDPEVPSCLCANE